MAGKVDDSVIERRLRPLYDWLDVGNNKKVMQEADKVLRKQPTLQCARVLKALAALRLGRKDDCDALIAAVVNEGPTDDNTLQALSICFREMHKPEEICKVYENAVKTEPMNEELLSHLFVSYVRIGDYKKQQQTAMQLYKVTPKNPYYFWAIMSIVMQALKNKDADSKRVSLMFAERMLTKFIGEDKIASEAEVLTYLYILEIQEKYEEALKVLDSPLSKKITQQPQNFFSLKKTNYLCKLEKWKDANTIYKQLIREEPDNWQYYIQYVNTVDKMSDSSEEPFNDGLAFLRDVAKRAKSGKERYRGPYFGVLQLALGLKERGSIQNYDNLQNEVMEHLYDYVANYGDKMCCFSDIVTFLPLVKEENAEKFLSRVHQLIVFDEKGIPIDIQAVYRDQIWLQLRRYLGIQNKLDWREHLDFANSMVSVYSRTAHLSADMEATDIRPNDLYLVLAGHSYIAAFRSLGDTAPDKPTPNEILVKLVGILEHGLNVSKANFQLKLLLIKVYNLIGASGAASDVYNKLDLKHIQLDTLGHTLLLQALDTANFTQFSAIVASTLEFFHDNYKYTSDPMITSYKFGSLTRIPEFVEFRDRLKNSLHFATVWAENMLFTITSDITKLSLDDAMKTGANAPLLQREDMSDLCDNRDLTVMKSWDPVNMCPVDRNKGESCKDDTLLLETRHTLLKLLYGMNDLVYNLNKSCDKQNGIINGESNEHFKLPVFLVASIKRLEAYKESLSAYSTRKITDSLIQGPDPARILNYSRESYLDFIVVNAKIFNEVYRCTQMNSLDSFNKEHLKMANNISSELLENHLKHLNNLGLTVSNASFKFNNLGLSCLVHFIETLGVAITILTFCSSLIKPIKSSLIKSNKKKKEAIKMPEAISSLSSYVNSLQLLIKKLEVAIKDVHKSVAKSHQESDLSWMKSLETPLADIDFKIVCDSINNSFNTSLTNLTSVVSVKLKLLNSLNF